MITRMIVCLLVMSMASFFPTSLCAQWERKPLPATHGCSSTGNKRTTRECLALNQFRDNKYGVFVVAHRGLWDNNIPENSIGSLRNAIKNKYMLVELDVNMSADKYLVVMHDQTFLRELRWDPSKGAKGIPTKYSDGKQEAFWGRNLNYKTPTCLNYDKNGKVVRYDCKVNTPIRVPPLQDAKMTNRKGQRTPEGLALLSEAFDVAAASTVILTLDIKENADVKRYMEILKGCIRLGAQKGILHKIIFKTPLNNAINIQPSTIKNSFGASSSEWYQFANQTNVIPLCFKQNFSDFSAWFTHATCAGMDLYYKHLGDNFFVKDVSTAKGNNQSPVWQTYQWGWRVGNYFEVPADCRGKYSGRGSWDDRGIEYDYKGNSVLDERGNPEMLLAPKVEEQAWYIIADSPSQMVKALNADAVVINPYNWSK